MRYLCLFIIFYALSANVPAADHSDKGSIKAGVGVLRSPIVMVSFPDLYVSEFSLDPLVPTEHNPVLVRIGVYNKGTTATGPFAVEWWPGEDYTEPEHTWSVDGLPVNGGQILTYEYSGYPSWYGSINTKVVIDPSNSVKESDEDNNIYKTPISVRSSDSWDFDSSLPGEWDSVYAPLPTTLWTWDIVTYPSGSCNMIGGEYYVRSTSFMQDGSLADAKTGEKNIGEYEIDGNSISFIYYSAGPTWVGKISECDSSNTCCKMGYGTLEMQGLKYGCWTGLEDSLGCELFVALQHQNEQMQQLQDVSRTISETSMAIIRKIGG